MRFQLFWFDSHAHGSRYGIRSVGASAKGNDVVFGDGVSALFSVGYTLFAYCVRDVFSGAVQLAVAFFNKWVIARNDRYKQYQREKYCGN